MAKSPPLSPSPAEPNAGSPASQSTSSSVSTVAGESPNSVLTAPAPADNAVDEVADRSPGVTWRAVLLSLGLAVFFGWIIPIIDLKTLNTFLGAAHLPPGAVAVLLGLLLVVNPLLKLLSKKAAFTRNEVLTVYITSLFSTLVPGHGAENFFVTNIIGPFYFATRENKWLEFMEPHLKPWMTPALWQENGQYGEQGQAAVQLWFQGTKGDIPWSAWLVPLIVWGTFIFVSYFMLACLSVMLRAQWADREALSFPLLRLPLEMTEDVDRPQHGTVGRFFRNPMMWVGFGIAVVIQTLNGLNLYFPDVPKVVLNLDTGPLFTEPPWNQVGWTPINIYPIAVGITYLLTSEISFSLWAFYWIIKFQYIAAYYAGFLPNTLPGMVGHLGGAKSFTGYQQVGCYLAYVAIVLYTGREHFGHILRRAFGRAKRHESEKREALSYPMAFWGFALSFVLLIAWSIAAGLTPILALMMWTLYLVIAIALSRIVCEGGLLFVQQGWTPLGAVGQITNAGGNHWLMPEASIPPAAVIQGAMMTDMRAFIMPSFIQGFKLAGDRGIRARPLGLLVLACSLITLALSLYMNVRLGYVNGGLQLDPWFAGGGSRVPATNSADMLKGVRDVNPWNLAWLGVGGVTTYLLMLARSRFTWFPLHPLGFLMSITYPMNGLWFSLFLGWLCKVLITRFGGSDTYRKTTPAFLGLALGDVAMMLVWLLIDGYFGRTGHKLMPA
jgi:hypothetical protein